MFNATQLVHMTHIALRRLLLVLLTSAVAMPAWAGHAPADWRVLTATASIIVGGATGGLIAGQGRPFTANTFTHALLNRRSKLSMDGKGAS